MSCVHVLGEEIHRDGSTRLSRPDAEPEPTFVEIAKRELGPACASYIQSLGERLAEFIEPGRDRLDVVLAAVFAEGLRQGEVSNEFLGYFLRLVRADGRVRREVARAPLLDPTDVIDSYLGALFAKSELPAFWARRSFLAYLVDGMCNRAKTRRRSLLRRKDHELQSASPEDPQEATAPVDALILREEQGELRRRFCALSERDQDMLGRRMSGDSAAKIAAALGMTPEAAQTAVRRAEKRLIGMS